MKPLALEEDYPSLCSINGLERDADFWYVRSTETGARLAIANPRPEHDEDGVNFTYDYLMIEGLQWRRVTDLEEDTYGDDVYEYLRASDWG